MKTDDDIYIDMYGTHAVLQRLMRRRRNRMRYRLGQINPMKLRLILHIYLFKSIQDVLYIKFGLFDLPYTARAS